MLCTYRKFEKLKRNKTFQINKSVLIYLRFFLVNQKSFENAQNGNRIHVTRLMLCGKILKR